MSHPFLEVLFNPALSAPSKQLQAARAVLFAAGHVPSVVIILPPAHLLNDVDVETLLADQFLLVHVLQRSPDDAGALNCVALPNCSLVLGKSTLEPLNGLPAGTQSVKIVRKRLWMPGMQFLAHDAAFMLIETDALLFNPSMLPRRWFGAGRSQPALDEGGHAQVSTLVRTHAWRSARQAAGAGSRSSLSSSLSPAPAPVPAPGTLVSLTPDLVPLAARRPVRNPALALELAGRDDAAAKVDYCVACMQQDAESSEELAARFHRAVRDAKRALQAFGAVLDISESDELAHTKPAANAFRLEDVYDYAEARLGHPILTQLTDLLDAERGKHSQSFYDIYCLIRNLDLAQVDIPGLSGAAAIAPAFERATIEAALVLGHLSEARLSAELCRTFLRAMSFLVDPKLGTVSADSLLGLFLLAILRTSPDAAALLERSVCFVSKFSFQASGNALARASAGRLSYTLMVVESVMLHVQSEHGRLKRLSDANARLWRAIRADDRKVVLEVAASSPSSITSRKNGKSALFMAAEDGNVALLNFLLSDLSQHFSTEFLLNDRDLVGRSLLMACMTVDSDEPNSRLPLSNVVLSALRRLNSRKLCLAYLAAADEHGRHIGFYASSPVKVALLVNLGKEAVNWAATDSNGDTAIISHLSTKHKDTAIILNLLTPCVTNFYDHIDKNGNSLLHFAANDLQLTQEVLKIATVNVNWKNMRGRTALFISRSDAVCKLLLDNGADPWALWGAHQQLCESVVCARALSITAAPIESAVYVSNTEMRSTKIINSHLPHAEFTQREATPADFAEFLSAVLEIAPTSWVPSLEILHTTPLESESSLGQLFYPELTLRDNIRVAVFIKQIMNHPVIGGLPETHRFLLGEATRREDLDRPPSADPIQQGPQQQQQQQQQQTKEPQEKEQPRQNEQLQDLAQIEPEYGKNHTTASASTLGSEDMESMLMFLQLGGDRLQTVQDALCDLVRIMCRSRNEASELTALVATSETSLHHLSLLIESIASKMMPCFVQAESKPKKRRHTFVPLVADPASLYDLIQTLAISELVKHTSDLQQRLAQPLKLSEKLAITSTSLRSELEQLKALASAKPKSAWLAPLESKRLSDIKTLEGSVSHRKKRVAEMELELRATHYSLANELGSFNSFHVDELLQRLKDFSLAQIQKHKEQVSLLQFGYKRQPVG